MRLLKNEANASAFGEAHRFRVRPPEVLADHSPGSAIGAEPTVGSPSPHLGRGAWSFAGEVGHTLIQLGGLSCHCGPRRACRCSLRQTVNHRFAEAEVQLTLNRAGEALGMLLTNLHHTLNPSDIVIGKALSRLPGPLMPTAPEFFAAHRHRLFSAARPVNVEVCVYSTFLPVRGAAAPVLSRVIQSLQVGA